MADSKHVGMTERGVKMPQTLQEYQYLTEQYERRMIADKQDISRLKSRCHELEQKLESAKRRLRQ